MDENVAKKRDEHQKELLRKHIRESLIKYSGSAADDKEENKATFKDFECYRKDVFLPKEVKDLKVRRGKS
jgi:nucleosome binding factor SPN SPT16 subunit